MSYNILGNVKKQARQLISVPRYWIPYRFSNGRALAPISVDIELTFRCNLRCKICPQEQYKKEKIKTENIAQHAQKQGEMTLDEIKELIDDLSKMGVQVITLTG